MPNYYIAEYKRSAGSINIQRIYKVSNAGSVVYVERRMPFNGVPRYKIGMLNKVNVDEDMLLPIVQRDFDHSFKNAMAIILKSVDE